MSKRVNTTKGGSKRKNVFIPIGIYLICASYNGDINSYLPLDGVSISNEQFDSLILE